MLVFVILHQVHSILKSLHVPSRVMLWAIFFLLHEVLYSIAPTFLDNPLIQNSVKVVELIVLDVSFDED